MQIYQFEYVFKRLITLWIITRGDSDKINMLIWFGNCRKKGVLWHPSYYKLHLPKCTSCACTNANKNANQRKRKKNRQTQLSLLRCFSSIFWDSSTNMCFSYAQTIVILVFFFTFLHCRSAVLLPHIAVHSSSNTTYDETWDTDWERNIKEN